MEKKHGIISGKWGGAADCTSKILKFNFQRFQLYIYFFSLYENSVLNENTSENICCSVSLRDQHLVYLQNTRILRIL